MYQPQSDVEAGEPAPTAAQVADVAAEPVRSTETDAEGSGQSPQDADAALARRMETIEARIDDLLAQVEDGLRVRASGNAEPMNVAEPLSPEEQTELRARADLRGRFSGETGTSDWGESASPPSIEVLVDHEPGGDQNVPDRVSGYLKMSDGVTT